MFATGDIGSYGRHDEYDAASAFFDALLKAAKLSKGRLFVIPGNHDVDRANGFFLRRTLNSDEQAIEFFAPDRPSLHIVSKQKAFFDWYNRYFDGIRNFPERSTCGPVEIVKMRSTRLGILPVNTALFCQDDDDQSQLWVGRRCLDAAIEEVRALDPTLTVALTHHPLDWLSPIEKATITSKLEENVQFILRGHLHETDAKAIINGNGQTIHLAAGAAYQSKKWPRQALYATLNRNKITIHPIRYSESPREAWIHDTSIFPKEESYNLTLPFRAAKTVKSAKKRIGKVSTARTTATSVVGKIGSDSKIRITIKRQNVIELEFLETGRNYLIDYSKVSKVIADHDINRAEFEKRVEREFVSHQIMLDFDYVEVGIPLLDGMTVFVTKKTNVLTIEYLMTQRLQGTLRNAWDRLNHTYRVALRLPYRKGHACLIHSGERERSFETVTDLVNEASNFYFETAKVARRVKTSGIYRVERKC